MARLDRIRTDVTAFGAPTLKTVMARSSRIGISLTVGMVPCISPVMARLDRATRSGTRVAIEDPISGALVKLSNVLFVPGIFHDKRTQK
jgi:hypothetical protein